MDRKTFLKNGIKALSAAMVIPLVTSCENEDDGITNGACALTPSETAGPFPTKNPASLEMVDITSDRTGIAMAITISIQDRNNNCAALEDAIVDIWHCDRDGYYSEYGGTGMQSADFTGVHFLKGRQITNAAGQVGFTSIFPGWYSGRATHIHVHIYDKNGNSLLVTQIAFPKDICDTVYTTATNYYTNGTQDTSNENDNVFGDGYTRELANISGSVNNGYQLTHTIVVDA